MDIVQPVPLDVALHLEISHSKVWKLCLQSIFHSWLFIWIRPLRSQHLPCPARGLPFTSGVLRLSSASIWCPVRKADPTYVWHGDGIASSAGSTHVILVAPGVSHRNTWLTGPSVGLGQLLEAKSRTRGRPNQWPSLLPEAVA